MVGVGTGRTSVAVPAAEARAAIAIVARHGCARQHQRCHVTEYDDEEKKKKAECRDSSGGGHGSLEGKVIESLNELELRF